MATSASMSQSCQNLSIINPRRQILPGPSLLHELIARPADDRLLLDFLQSDGTHVRLSYRRFHFLTDFLARVIQPWIARSGRDQVIVPAIIPQCPELYVAWVAVLKAGAGYCPVNLDVPAERLKFIAKDVDATFVLTTSAELDRVQRTLEGLTVLSVSLTDLQASADAETMGELSHSPPQRGSPQGPAYVMYTSGSTGLPKGVKVSHQSVTQSLLAHEEHIPIFKRFLQFAAPTFDVSIFEIFFPFYRGSTLVGCERERMLADLPQTIVQLDADAAELTPTVAGTLLRTREAAPCLKTLLTIGEMLTTQVVAAFGGTGDKPSMLYAMYGPTEAAIHCTIAPRLDASSSVRSIGRPFSTVTAFVLREGTELEIATIGEAGELAIAGQLADGYLNRPDQNAAAFLNLPGHGAIYKTGDRAICQANGELEILGRMSAGQVKIRGQRVELGEIEEVASKVPGLQVAVACVIDDVLVLFCAGSTSVDQRDVASICKSWLPAFMRPREIVMLENVPRLPSGKIDRKTLESNYQHSRSVIDEGEDAANDIERDISAAIKDELGIHLHRSTSLWSSGLDSLRSIKVASNLRRKYPYTSAAMILEAENLAELATVMESSNKLRDLSYDKNEQLMHDWDEISKSLNQDPNVTKADQPYDRLLPCSPMQIAMLVETFANDKLNFNDIWLKLNDNITFEDFEEAFRNLAESNEILRSGFIATGSQSIPFAQIVWQDLESSELSLLRPVQFLKHESDGQAVLVRIHHAIYDGWSWDLILDDLNLILSGRSCPERTQYSDFYESHLAHTTAEVNADIDYWRRTLESLVPTSFPSLSSTIKLEENRKTLKVPLSITNSQIAKASQELRCSRATILESAWAFLLSSYLDSPDFSFGIVSAGRHIALPGVETIIGPCLATLPLRIELDAVKTAHDLVDHVQRQHIACLHHGSLSLHDILQAAHISRETKLFDTLCVWQEDTMHTVRDRSKISTLETRDALAYALVLEFEPEDDSVMLKLTFDASQIPEQHASLLASQLEGIAANIIENSEIGLESLWHTKNINTMSISNPEYRKFTNTFDLTSTISKLARTNPSQTAIEFVQDFQRGREPLVTTLTYQQLYHDASKVAFALLDNYSVKPDDLICLLASKSIELYVGILGVILAGAAYLCIDVRTPAERIRQILHESKSSVVMTNGYQEHNLQAEAGHDFVPINDLVKSECSATNSLPTCLPHTLAYAVFTSGSTGVPKGVLITRQNLLSNIEELSRIYPSDSTTDKLLQACSPAFDVSVFEIFWTWHSGMTLCAAANDVLFRNIEDYINFFEITHLSLTPSVAALVDRDNVPGVKMLVTAGEPMNSKVFANWKGRGLYQGYGPSETTNICNVRPQVSDSDGANNVGPGFSNTSLFIGRKGRSAEQGDRQYLGSLQLLPKGAVGEIWIGGEQVGRGYIDPRLTEKSFFGHPEYGQLYRSGDLGRLLSDGSLLILGREDDQVKLRGQRIELGEINSALLKCDNVMDAVSMILPDGTNRDRLITFWSPSRPPSEDDLPATTADYFARLQNLLPVYMIPDTLLYMREMPLTRQGKADRRAMADVFQQLNSSQLLACSRGHDDSKDLEPLTTSEQGVAEILGEVLAVSTNDIKRNSSFYALGLDSINAIRVARMIKARGYHSVEVSTVLQNSSIGKLMNVIGTSKETEIEDSGKNSLRGLSGIWDSDLRARYTRAGHHVDRFLHCTPLQESMVTTSLNSPTHAYVNRLKLQVFGEIEKLRNCWRLAVERHQVLRTGFAALDSAETPYVQVVLKDFPLPWHKSPADAGLKEELDHLMLPPWSIQIDEKDGVLDLILEIHHALYDGEAMSILLAEIETSYSGLHLSTPVPFDGYLDFMEAQNKTEIDDFWRGQLEGIEPSILTDVLPQQVRSESSLTVTRNSSVLLSTFRDHAKKLSTTSLAVLQTAWSRLLSSLLQTRDVCFGNVLSGRNLPVNGVERMIAPCFNTVPLRIRMRQNMSNENLCHVLQQTNVNILPFQPSSLRRIQRQNVEGGRRLFDTLILLQTGEVRLDEKIWSLQEETGDMSFPFILEVVLDKVNNALNLRLHSESACHEFLEKLVASFDSFLDHTIKFPQARASDFAHAATCLPMVDVNVKRDRTTDIDSHVERKHLSISSDNEIQVVKVIRSLKPELAREISKSTTIFHLGLDSINAVQIAAQLRKLGYELSSADILEAATIERIASLLSRDSATEAIPGLDLQAFENKYWEMIGKDIPMSRDRVQFVRPCTSTQSGIISEYLKSQGKLYYNSMRFSLDHDLDIQQLRQSWNAAMGKHDMLRTGFISTDHPTYPFAMVTYQSKTTELPWNEDHKSSQGGDRSKFAIEDLANPPWQLRLERRKEGMSLELSMLHALYDARSLQIILNDVASFYHGKQPPASIPLDAILSRLLVQGRDARSQEFWSKSTSKFCPTRFPDMNIFHEEDLGLGITTQECRTPQTKIEATCAKAGANLQALFVAAWGIVLSTYTAQNNVTLGLVLSGRDFDVEDAQNLAFPCINTIPFPVEVSKDYAELLQKCVDLNAKVSRHQHTPLSLIKRWTGIEETLFDTMIALQKYNSADESTHPWSQVEDKASAEYTISLEIFEEANDKFRFQLTHRNDLVPPGQAMLILQEFEEALSSIIAAVESKSFEASEALLSVLPPTEARFPTSIQYLHEFVETSAEKHPEKVALEFITDLSNGQGSNQKWSYEQLNSAGNQIANLLLSHGVQTGDLVAVCFDKCPEASFAILGSLKAGCGYLAIDPAAPKARKSFILEDSACKIVLTADNNLGDFTNTDRVEVISLSDGHWQDQSRRKPKHSVNIDPQDTCYCLYTSGTTGTPKGCLISHDSAVQAMLSFQHIFKGRWNTSSRWLQFASFHFDVSVLEQYWSWSVGICVTSVPRDLLFEDLPGTISALEITHLDLTPSLARLLTPEEVPSLCEGVFIVGGEQLRQDILDTWGNTKCLYNFYGPSEVTIGCTVHPNVTAKTKPTNIGQQWRNVGSFVLEPKKQKPVVRGAVGELCLSGPLVGKGYLNRPDLTAEKFVTLEKYDTRVYRTGDLVRLLHDNSFEFLGRMDDQVKLRGQRLEIGEINHTIIHADLNIKDATTMVLKHPVQQKDQLVSFFSTSNKRKKDEEPEIISNSEVQTLIGRIKRHCSDRLPAYMIPTYYYGIPSIPLTINNKVDRKSLKALFEQAIKDLSTSKGEDSRRGGDIAGLDEVIAILSKFLQLPASSLDQSSRLFELGLDSISAIGLSRSFKRNGYGKADVATILKNTVVGELAREIQHTDQLQDEGSVQQVQSEIDAFAKAHCGTITKVLDFERKDIACIAPCTPLQEGMISKVMRSSPSDTTYFSGFYFQLANDIHLEALADAWRDTEKCTAILRTYFTPTVDGYAQVALRLGKSAVVNVQALQNGEKHPSIPWSRYFSDWVVSARRFGKEVPWKVDLITFGRRKFMSLFMFHGLYDGISLRLLLNKVKETYLETGAHATSDLSFFESLAHGPLRRQPEEETFWKKHLSIVRRLDLPEKGQKGGKIAKSLQIRRILSSKAISETCKKLNVTLPALFQAAWLSAIEKFYKVNPTIGVVVSGRGLALEHSESVIGPMFNTLPFSVQNLAKGASFADLVRACHHLNVNVIPFSHTPLRRIARYIGQEMRDGLFDTLFVFQKPAEQSGEELWNEIPSEATPDYPLNLEVEQETHDRFVITIATKPNFVDEGDAQSLLELYLTILKEEKGLAMPIAENFCESHHDTVPNKFARDHDSQRNGGPNKKQEVIDLSGTELAVRTQLAKLAAVPEQSINRHDPTIFELGLDSIEAMKLVTRLKYIAPKISIGAIMRSPTVGGIAGIIESNKRGDRKDESNGHDNSIANKQAKWYDLLAAQGIDTQKVQRVLPVTSMQEGLLMDSSNYFNVFVYKLKSKVTTEMLKQTLEKVIRQEPILRTRITNAEADEDGVTFLQYVVRDCGAVKVLQNRQIASVVARLKDVAESLGIQEQSFQVRLIQSDEGNNYMILGAPHALYDALSLHLLHEQIAYAYAKTEIKDDNKERVQYEDHLEEVASQARSAEAKGFWKQLVRDTRPTTFANHLDIEHPSTEPILVQISAAVSLDQASKVCRTNGVTLQSLGLLCWSLAVAHVTRSLDVCFGLVLSGRTTGESGKLVFPTFNTVLFRSSVEKDGSKADALKSIHRSAIQVAEHQHYPLKDILRLARAQSNHTNFFDALFTFQKLPTQDSGESRIPVLYEECKDTYSQLKPPYPINVEFETHSDGLKWTVAVQSGVADRKFVDKLSHMLDDILESIVKAPQESLIRHDSEAVFICELPAIRLRSEGQISVNGHTQMASDSNGAATESNWSSVEAQIRTVLAKVAKIGEDEISKTSSIFHLGLDSVSAIKVASLLKNQGIRLPVSDIVKAQTIEKMALVCRVNVIAGPVANTNGTQGPSGPSPAALRKLGIDPNDVEDVLPATPGQTSALDVWTASKGRLFYPTFWFHASRTTKAELEEALFRLSKSVPILRTKFVYHEVKNVSSIWQVVFRDTSSTTNSLPWSIDSEDYHGGQLLTLKIHHALYDAVSLELMVSLLEELFQDRQAIPKPNIGMKDFGTLLRKYAGQAKHFWQRYLSDQATIASNLASGSFSAKRAEQYKPKVLQASSMKVFLRQHGLSIQAFFFAVYARAYLDFLQSQHQHDKEFGSKTDVVLGVYLANRSLDIDRLTELVAPTFNIVPLRVHVHGRSISDIAVNIQQDLAEITKIENCGVSMYDIYNWTGVQVDTYLNFLSLPGTDSNEAIRLENGHEVNKVEITHAMLSREEKDKVAHAEPASPFINNVPENSSRSKWCLPSIDIEVKIDDGHLGIGVFAPEDMLSQEEAENMIDDMKRLMRNETSSGV